MRIFKQLSSKSKLVLLVAAVIIVGGGAYLVTKDEGKVSVNKELQSKCTTQVNDETFCKFAGAFANAGDYKVSVSSSDQSGASTIELASDSKGNSSMVVTQGGQEQANIIVFNGVTYLKDSTDGQWFKFSSTDANKPEVLDLKKEIAKGDFKGDAGQALQYKQIGTEACGNLTCFKYQVIDPNKPNEEGFLWFDTKDYLLRRVTAKSNGSTTDMNLTYTKVSISEPSSTKDLPSVSPAQ
ncbi:hypothetical protein HYS84_00945 [Candidatus Saccharibacteria bacterium]|nr:hypothetical protein [Candidatus Saccharibacteria bacterium]